MEIIRHANTSQEKGEWVILNERNGIQKKEYYQTRCSDFHHDKRIKFSRICASNVHVPRKSFKIHEAKIDRLIRRN